MKKKAMDKSVFVYDALHWKIWEKFLLYKKQKLVKI